MHSIIAMIALLVARGIDRAMQDQDGKTATNYLQDSNVHDLADFINGTKSAEWMNDNTVKQVLSTRSMK
jgi:precorrin isomerase